MKHHVQRHYWRLREHGWRPVEAMRAARTIDRFEDLEYLGLVRVIAEPEQDHPFDVFGEPEGYRDASGRWVSAEEERKEYLRLLEIYGNWVCIAQVNRGAPDDPQWETVDSIGMCDGYKDPLDPSENCYIPDLMSAAILEADLSEVCS